MQNEAIQDSRQVSSGIEPQRSIIEFNNRGIKLNFFFLNRHMPENIQTIKPGGAKGIKITTTGYLKIARSILNQLSRNSDMTTIDLLNRVEEDVKDISKVDMAIIVLHVKLHLEAHGYLKSIVRGNTLGRSQKNLWMTRKGWNYLKSILEVDQTV